MATAYLVVHGAHASLRLNKKRLAECVLDEKGKGWRQRAAEDALRFFEGQRTPIHRIAVLDVILGEGGEPTIPGVA